MKLKHCYQNNCLNGEKFNIVFHMRKKGIYIYIYPECNFFEKERLVLEIL